MLTTVIATLNHQLSVRTGHQAAALAKMEQAMGRLAASKGISLFKTDYLE
jgi:hypothetical protein